MPIKNSVSGNVPYLQSYTPFNLQNGLVEADTISKMITYNFKPGPASTKIEYVIGSSDLYIKTLNVKNITTNTDIQVSIRYFKNIFFINYEGRKQVQNIGTDITEINTIISSGITADFDILLNNSLIDSGITKNSINAKIEVSVKNLQNGKLITKNTNAFLYDDVYFPQRVRIE